ncbi:MAG: heme oxygenase [Hydrogenophilales bacterium 17-64-11]|nr:MAG: heme oxygenase [Hydrogenophilales bacterium 17-64-11]
MLNADFIESLRVRLDAHPIYAAVATPGDLRVFMQHHVYSVWDFMSLIKYLQNEVAPARWPWMPGSDAAVQRFINEMVLEEETDVAPPGQEGHTSHFMLYLAAMREIGADPGVPARFVQKVAEEGVDAALDAGLAPTPSVAFTRTTFDFLASGKPHTVAAALALGREHIIPSMFRALLSRMAVTEAQAPSFHYYLNRHVHLDGDSHAPLSLRLLAALCGDDPGKWREAEAAAETAVDARLQLWDGALAALPGRQSKAA